MSKNGFYGITREDEERKLAEVNKITESKLNATKQMVQSLADELHEQKEVYDADDKEGLAQWFNTDARFQEVRQDLLRAERARKKPFFGRIDFVDDEKGEDETYYIGKTLIAKDPSEPIVIDWRTPIASVYYDHSLGKCSYKVPREGTFNLDLKRKRTYEIEDNKLKNYYDSDVVANDDLLTEYLSKSKRNVLSEIIATIQQEQNEIIRMNPRHNILVQGSAGSGKTTVAMHRISYILYNYDLEFKPESFYIIGSNKVLLNYITGVLPDLDVFGVRQMTMEDLFVRLLYEEWDKKIKVRKADKYDVNTGLKGTEQWFKELKAYCDKFEWNYIPRVDVKVEKTGHVLIRKEEIEKVLKQYNHWSMYDKFDKMTDILISRLETEIYGKYYSYSVEEQKALFRSFKQYYKKMQWEDSIFDFYEKFLDFQRKKGLTPTYASGEVDIYDLAALSYIYKRFKETEVIQEASHVVIDEAQDFGMMIYYCLKYSMSKCTFTIMGDVSQNINLNSGLGDWESLKKLMLPDKYDAFGLLRKSYRNTVEISKFATDILKHGNFPIYPVEPIVRHGEAVSITNCDDNHKLTDKLVETLESWQKKNYETIAVITKDIEESHKVASILSKHIEVKEFSDSDTDFGAGIMIIPIEYSKGLEFDAVAIYNPTNDAYPMEDGYAKLLYVAATRALHELSIVYTGKITDLIGTPIPADHEKNLITEDNQHLKPFVFEEDTRTLAEVARDLSKEGDAELRLRDKYGPKRIVVNKPKVEEKPKPRATVKGSVSTLATANIYKTPDAAVRQTTVKPAAKVTIKSEFGTMPEGTSLQAPGHGRIDNSVRWIKAGKTEIEITGGYGTLRILPIADDTVRIAFSVGPSPVLAPLPSDVFRQSGMKWKVQESREAVDVSLMKLRVHVDKKSGAISFFNSKNQLILSESATLPRQYHEGKKTYWEYLEFSKKESLTSHGREDFDWPSISNSAQYISHQDKPDRAALIMSNKGYQILVPNGIKTLICTIPAFGPYVAFENSELIDYIFRTAI